MLFVLKVSEVETKEERKKFLSLLVSPRSLSDPRITSVNK